MEYFQLCSDRLAAGGIMCAWAPTPRVYATFCQVFPHVLEVNGGEILLGSRIPLDPDVDLWSARLQTPEVAEYLGRQLTQEMLQFIRTARPANRERYRLAPNRDLFPRDEFMTPTADALRFPVDERGVERRFGHSFPWRHGGGSVDRSGRFCVRSGKISPIRRASGGRDGYGGTEAVQNRPPKVSHGHMPFAPQPLSHRVHPD